MQRGYKFLDRLKLYWQSSEEQKMLTIHAFKEFKVLNFKSIANELLIIVNTYFISYLINTYIAANFIYILRTLLRNAYVHYQRYKIRYRD